MSDIPEELKYLPSHEWVRLEDDGETAVIGITQHAQDLLGDVVFVELPEVGTNCNAGEEAGVVESVKAASDIFFPLSGVIAAVNEDLEDAPELVNSDPYHDGWFFKVKMTDANELSSMLDASAYAELCESDEH